MVTLAVVHTTIIKPSTTSSVTIKSYTTPVTMKINKRTEWFITDE
jgi:putative effector of murein hydrolase